MTKRLTPPPDRQAIIDGLKRHIAIADFAGNHLEVHRLTAALEYQLQLAELEHLDKPEPGQSLH